MSAAIVTGASRGIGRAVALALAARGLDVALLARDLEALSRVADEASAFGVRALVLACDVAREGDIAAAVAGAVEVLGAPEVVVNNAGVIRRGLVHEQPIDDLRHVLDVDLVAPMLVARAALPSMLARGRGRLVQVASVSATLGTAGAAAYCAAKWGLVGFTKSLAEELRGTGLAAMAVLPGSVDTAMLAGSGFDPDMAPDDVARTITFLALDAPLAMNGSAVEVFGP